MNKFKYTAIDTSGIERVGSISARNEEEASIKLSGMGLMVSSLALDKKAILKKKPAGPKKSLGQINIGKIVNDEGLAIFTRQMATLLQAGLPLLRSLEVMIRQEKNLPFKQVIISIADHVRSGNNFSDGLALHPKIFDKIYINMVRAGEASGVLELVLSRLARFKEKSLYMAKKVKSAMVYPFVIIAFATLIVTFIMWKIVPKFEEIFQNMLKGAELPLLTQYIMAASNLLRHNFLLLCGGLIVAIFGFKLLVKTPLGGRGFDWVLLHMPKFGELFSKVAISRFTRTFGTLLSSGVPILHSLTITRDIVGNRLIIDALNKVHDRVRDGESLAAPLEQQKIFPTMVTSMIDVGEETGELPEMLNRIADNYDEDVDNAVASLTSIIEPIMIVGLAVVVGIIVIGIFLPIVEVINQMG